MAAIGVGERAPDFVLPDPRGMSTRFYGVAGGRPCLLLFSVSEGAATTIAGAIEGLDVAAVFSGGEASVAGPGAHRRRFVDLRGHVRRAYGVGEEAAAFLLDPNLRVVARFEPVSVEALVSQVEAAHALLPAPAPARIIAQAPVLLVPGALADRERTALLDVWARQGHEETGVEATRDGRRAQVLDADAKRRRDHTVTDPELLQLLTATLGRRLLPELQKAFAYRATRFEGFKIGCYDAADGGRFGAHRDNLSPATAHRRFALSLNLNDDYEGGEIVFPEYGPFRYRPAAGEALVFSGALLHEVRPVTGGRRFVLVSFLFDEAAAKSRQAAAGDAG